MLLVCVNMTGTDKRKILLIDKSKSPHCFKGVDQQQLPVTYRNNSAAWMTFVIFQDWLFAWDHELCSNNWHICLLVDNATSHPNSVELTNILPPNTTSLMQPMDQGVIHNFKHFYHEQIQKCLVNALDAELINPETSATDMSQRFCFSIQLLWHTHHGNPSRQLQLLTVFIRLAFHCLLLIWMICLILIPLMRPFLMLLQMTFLLLMIMNCATNILQMLNSLYLQISL